MPTSRDWGVFGADLDDEIALDAIRRMPTQHHPALIVDNHITTSEWNFHWDTERLGEIVNRPTPHLSKHPFGPTVEQWLAEIQRLGYARGADIDLDRAATTYLLLTIPVQPHLPEQRRMDPYSRAANAAMSLGLPTTPRDVIQVSPNPPRPLRPETMARIEAGLRRFTQN